jgi:ankyrin repeat protein
VRGTRLSAKRYSQLSPQDPLSKQGPKRHGRKRKGSLSPAAIRLLLERQDSDPNPKEESGWTPLMIAAGKGHESVVRLAVGRGRRRRGIQRESTPMSHSAGNEVRTGHRSEGWVLSGRTIIFPPCTFQQVIGCRL